MTHKARKRFGQNFLHDSNIIYQIISSLNAKSADHWVEIGAGLGALTEPLLKMVHHLDVVELDRDLVQFLTEKFNEPHLHIHSADALRFNFADLIKTDEKLRVVGNLPYNISTPLMFHLLENAQHIDDMHFMLQKEVVDRICAKPNSKKYGRLSIMMQYFCETEWLFDVPPESFNPIPQVMSAIVRLVPYEKSPVFVRDVLMLNRVVTEAFSQRRKTLRNSLKKLLTEQQLNDLEIDSRVRAENLSLADFAKIANFVCL